MATILGSCLPAQATTTTCSENSPPFSELGGPPAAVKGSDNFQAKVLEYFRSLAEDTDPQIALTTAVVGNIRSGEGMLDGDGGIWTKYKFECTELLVPPIVSDTSLAVVRRGGKYGPRYVTFDGDFTLDPGQRYLFVTHTFNNVPWPVVWDAWVVTPTIPDSSSTESVVHFKHSEDEVTVPLEIIREALAVGFELRDAQQELPVNTK